MVPLRDVFVGVGIGTLLLVHMSIVLRSVCPLNPVRAVQRAAEAIASGLRELVGIRSRRRTPPCSAIDDYVAAELLERQVCRAKGLAQHALHVMPLAMVPFGLNLLTGHGFYGRRWFTVWQDCIFLLAYAVFLLLRQWPRLLNARTMDFWASLFMGITVLFTAPGVASPESFPSLRSFMMPAEMIRVLVAIACMRVAPFLLWDAVNFAVLGCWHLLPRASAPCGIPDPRLFLMAVAFSLACTVATISVLQTSARAELRREAEARSWRDESSAASALLGTVCDVVLELDAELRIVGDAPKLSALLLRAPGRRLDGVPLYELMPDESDRRYLDRAKQELPLQSDMYKADVFHACMRDGNGSPSAMELFSVRFRGFDGQVRHLMGMREAADAAPVAPLRAEGRFSRPQAVAAEGAPGPQAGHRGQLQGDGEAPEASEAEETPEPSAVWPSEQAIAVKICVNNPRLPIKQFTPQFASVMGLSFGSLNKHVAPGNLFQMWLRWAVSMHCTDGSTVCTRERCSLWLQLYPRREHCKLVYRATAVIDFSESGSMYDDELNLWVEFQDLQLDSEETDRRSSNSSCSSGHGSRDASRGTANSIDARHAGTLVEPTELGRKTCSI